MGLRNAYNVIQVVKNVQLIVHAKIVMMDGFLMVNPVFSANHLVSFVKI